ncbi:MAG: DUF2505 domain-containing protein [Propionibacteriaceae bacterium]|jgi:hypothetical protein|nr:DUF2505 domain-containing protein [Propionibacteriaceae bacterium]
MHIHAEHHYDAQPDTTYAMLTDPQFLESLLTRAGALSHTVSVSDGRTSAMARVASPAQAKKFTGDSIAFTLVIDWRADAQGYSGPISVDVDGLPARLSGTASIRGAEVGTTVTYDGDFTIRIPFVGSKLEATAAPHLLKVIDAQQPLGTQWLAEH